MALGQEAFIVHRAVGFRDRWFEAENADVPMIYMPVDVRAGRGGKRQPLLTA